MKKDYYELAIPIDKLDEEKLYAILFQNGIKTTLEEYGLIKVYFEEKKKAEQLRKLLIEEMEFIQSSLIISKLPQHDWNKEWKDTIEPVIIKNKIIIYPSWKKDKLKNTKDKIHIEIDPKMSFGTGHNETTQMIIGLMCEHISDKDKYLLDYGCGTAVLSIAGIKLGIEKAVAIDIDADSIRDAKEYIKVNKVNKNIRIYKSDIKSIDEKGFDVIVCNIDRTVITKNIKKIYSKLKKDGKLFITGILLEELNEILQLLSVNKFKLIETRSKAEWLSFYAVRNN